MFSLVAFFDELEKIAATSVMKPLGASARKFMERMTGFSRGASIPQPASARRLRHALTSSGTPSLMTEMHLPRAFLNEGELQAKQQARQHFEGVLAQQGKTYRGVPGLSEQIKQIGGHSGALTRTPARVGPAPSHTALTVPAHPTARRALETAATRVAPTNPADLAMAGAA